VLNVSSTTPPNFKSIFAAASHVFRYSGLVRKSHTRSIGPGSSSVTQTDWHDQAEQTFLTQLAHKLDAAVAAGKAKSIIMVASPRALGMIRPAYSHALRAAVRTEVHKDLVKLPIHEIEKHLTAA
jgi:protein required for attachment to host cells